MTDPTIKGQATKALLGQLLLAQGDKQHISILPLSTAHVSICTQYINRYLIRRNLGPC